MQNNYTAKMNGRHYQTEHLAIHLTGQDFYCSSTMHGRRRRRGNV